jgi:uncharacterized DUF497 family protein
MEGRSSGIERIASTSQRIISSERVSISDVEEVLTDADRDERYDARRDTYLVLGRTKAGRWLVVVWVNHPRGWYPIHVRPASAAARRKWEKQ